MMPNRSVCTAGSHADVRVFRHVGRTARRPLRRPLFPSDQREHGSSGDGAFFAMIFSTYVFNFEMEEMALLYRRRTSRLAPLRPLYLASDAPSVTARSAVLLCYQVKSVRAHVNAAP